jgi:regulatory protein
MRLLSLKPGDTRREGVFKAEFSGGVSLLLAADYLPEGGAAAFLETAAKKPATEYAGLELVGSEEEAFRFAAACYKAEKTALRLIARAEQNSLGLAAKLKRRGHSAAAIKAVVSCLSGRNLLNDGRYAERWLRSRLPAVKALSPRLLLSSLAKRGIPRDASLEALKTTLDEEAEYALLLHYLEEVGSSEHKRGVSLKARLRYEGFSLAVINRYFDSL